MGDANPIRTIGDYSNPSHEGYMNTIELPIGNNVICSGPHYTQYCMENPEQVFVKYASSRIDKAGDARLSKFEANSKQQQSEMTNKIDTVLKAITDRMAGALPSDTVKNQKLNVNSTTLVLSARSYPTEDPQCSTHTHEITFKMPYKDPERSELSSKGHDLLSSRIILSEDDYDRGCRKPSDLEDRFYKNTIKLGLEYVTGMDDE
ncbi:hypothetical protein Tco_0753557 [Tanacetum coccineum]